MRKQVENVGQLKIELAKSQQLISEGEVYLRELLYRILGRSVYEDTLVDNF
jgi:hypothetical protein